jgi:hypothetical protein
MRAAGEVQREQATGGLADQALERAALREEKVPWQ